MSYRKRCRLAAIIAGATAICTVPLTVHAAEINLPVPKITIYPGEPITGDVLAVKPFTDAADQMPMIRTPDAAIGKVARRTLVAGKPIPVSYVHDADLVKQGKLVRVVFAEGPLTISSVAVALQSGGLGDLLTLRNMDSGAVIKGTVQSDGSVRVAGP